MDINWTSLLTGVAGGIIPAAVAYFMGNKNVKTSLQINQERINFEMKKFEKELNARSKEQASQFKYQLCQIAYEDKKKYCLEFLDVMKPSRIANGKYDIEKAVRCLDFIEVFTEEEYFKKASELEEYLMTNLMIFSSDAMNSPNENERNEHTTAHIKYIKLYLAFVAITRALFRGENLSSSA